jgi:hypothetical protein
MLAQRVTVGLSSIVGITLASSQNAILIKKISGGSLEIGGTYSLSSTGATTPFTWGNGFLVGNSELISGNISGQFYLAATGATVTCNILRGLD